MNPPSITPATYTALVAAFGKRPGNIARAAADAGVNRNTARKAWTGGYVAQFSWAPAISAVLDGTAPLPVFPIAPESDAAPRRSPPVPIRALPDRTTVVLERPRPNLRKPSPVAATPAFSPDERPAERDPRTAAQNRALADVRRLLSARVESMARQGPAFDAYMEWLMNAAMSYAESMSDGAHVTLRDLMDAAQVGGMIASVWDRFAQSTERAVATERKLNPPPPASRETNTTQMGSDELKQKLGLLMTRWGYVKAEPDPPEVPLA